MEYSDLRIFEAVARNRSMNRAATELHMVQSNVTARIRLLESEVGVALFERSSRGVAVTAAGGRLLPYIARIGALIAEAQEATRDDGVPRGQIRIGALEATAAIRMPPILSAYTQTYPNVGLYLATGTTGDLISDVLGHRLDGAFVAGPIHHGDLSHEWVFREGLVILTARTIRSLSELDERRDLRAVVFGQGCAYRQRLEAWLLDRGIQIATPLEFGSLETILGCVAADVGITLLPRSVTSNIQGIAPIVMHELPRDWATVDTVFVQRKDRRLPSATTAFLKIARTFSPVSSSP